MLSLKGNVGDSRCVASVRGQVEQLSFDHKPGNETETKRIISAGGWVEFNRVNGKIQSLKEIFTIHALVCVKQMQRERYIEREKERESKFLEKIFM